MSVIGIDFGNESCYVAVARAGGIETIANDYSLRATPSCVAFSGKNRLIGVAAKNQMVTNMKNTISGFKRLLGRNYTDPFIYPGIKERPYRAEEIEGTGGIGIKVNYLDEEQLFSPEQIAGMLFTKLKDISETALKAKINDCVISVPSFFTNIERKALLDAATIAGLNVLRLLNETTATALAYGIYKQDLPSVDERPRNVVFVDCGYSSLQVSVCALHKGKLRMLAYAADSNLGGSDFDQLLANYFCSDFQSRYHIDPRNNARAYLRLTNEVEKLKKQMSANSTKLPLNIECFMDDIDVRGDMKREDMEDICAHLFERVETVLRKCLEDSNLMVGEIYAVEIVGGSSRIPAIKNIIEVVFGKSPSTTLNQDEAVARGCALQCAMLSPAIRVREFNVTDVQNYPIHLLWEDALGTGEMEAFPQNHPVPFSKMLTFYRKQPFAIRAIYAGDVPLPDLSIGHVVVSGVKPTSEGESQKVKVKVRINLHGILTITNASMVEKREPGDLDLDDSDGMDTDQNTSSDEAPANGHHSSDLHINSGVEEESGHSNVASDSAGDMGPDAGSSHTYGSSTHDKHKKKNNIKVTELPVDAYWTDYTSKSMNECIELECKMIANDRQEKERVDARNALEEYVYELRGKLTADEELATFVTGIDRVSIFRQLDDMEIWLYEEGENCNRQVYVDKLVSLKNLGDPIEARRIEFESRDAVLEDFSVTLQLTQKTVDQYHNRDARYVHLKGSEIEHVQQMVDQGFKWLEEQRIILTGTPRTENPSVIVDQIRQERESFLASVNPIMNQQKAPSTEAPHQAKGGETVPEQGDVPVPNQASSAGEKMDVE